MHKSQGATVERAYVMASKLFDASTTHVSLSRQREHVELHWAREEFGTRAELDRILCRERPKELALEQFDGRTLKLSEVLKDEPRFELLAPATQHSLITKYEKAYAELRAKKPVLSTHEELSRHPRIVAAVEREAALAKKYSDTSKRLYEYGVTKANLPWWKKMKEPKHVCVDANERAKEAYWKAEHAREALERDPELNAEVSKRVSENNLSLAAHQDRIKAWRAHVEAVERAGIREHVVEQLSKRLAHPVRWTTSADEGVKFEVVRATKLEFAGKRSVHVAFLKAPGGAPVLHEIKDYEVRSLRPGEKVELKHGIQGLSLGVSRGMGFSR